jgi:hypothetical protein
MTNAEIIEMAILMMAADQASSDDDPAVARHAGQQAADGAVVWDSHRQAGSRDSVHTAHEELRSARITTHTGS